MPPIDHPLAFTNIELEGIFRQRVRKRIPKIWEFERKVPDPYAPKQYVKVLMFVPHPTLEAPYPCILTMIATAHRSVFFRLARVDDLPGVLFLGEEEVVKCREALCNAQEEADQIEEILRDHLARRKLPHAISRASELEESAEAEKLRRSS